MDPLVNAALSSWAISPASAVLLLLSAAVYIRGWYRGRRLSREANDVRRLAAFLAGLALLFVAADSPLDVFDSLFLSAHMAQHLLLMMFAPLLVLLGDPMLPLLRGLPKTFVKEGLAPFLTWPLLRRFFALLTAPPVAWLAFAFSTVFWHLPAFYELALGSPFWHGVQHASFFWTGILFWWPVVQPGPGKSKWPAWTAIPYLLFADIINTALSAFFVFSGHALYPSYDAVRASSFSVQDDQTLAGLIMWVPGSLVYLLPAFVMVIRLFSSPGQRPAPDHGRWRRVASAPHGHSWLKRTVRGRRALQSAMLLLAIAVMMEGWWGPQVTPLNLAGVLPWIHWRAFSVLALLVVGNLFCMVCPFTLARDMGRKILPAKLRWPGRLRNKWAAVALLVLYLWAYEAFGLWNSPWRTAWIIAGYFGAALLVDGLFRGASFCKYVCPIGQFHFVSSLISPREIAVKRQEVCQSCKTYDCIRGNSHSRGCELDLFQPKKVGNLDCTFCLDCVKACPHDNVSILPILPASTLVVDPYRSSIGKLSKRSDLAVLALVFVFGAFVNAAGMIAPVMMWEHSWHARLGPQTMPYIVAAFVLGGVLVIPALAVLLCGGLNRLAGVLQNTAGFARRLAFTLVPLGFGMWAAHLLYHFVTSWNAAWPAIVSAVSPGSPVVAGTPYLPGWLTPAQILLLNAGLITTLLVGWRIAMQSAGRLRSAVSLMSPWAVLSVALYSFGAWILFQPMQMRGMIP